MVIEQTEFPVVHDLKVVSLQGDCGLRIETSPTGGLYVTENPARARETCLNLVHHARSCSAHLALVPELTIPKDAIGELVDAVGSAPDPLVFLGGLEGLTIDDYRGLCEKYSSPLDIPATPVGTYVNAMIVVVRQPGSALVRLRAKRIPSGPENSGGPQMVMGQGPFLALKLGSSPYTVVPLICSELIWPQLWSTLDTELSGLTIDVIPVLQRNDDIDRRHTGPAIHYAYQNNRPARFVLANQGITKGSDGTCYVLVPPTAPASPSFDQGRNELWLPDSVTYRGFRLPERLGCYWFTEIVHRHGPMNATRPHVCGGRVLEVLSPTGPDVTGLPAGLLRAAAASLDARPGRNPLTQPELAYRGALKHGAETYVLSDATRTSASGGFFQLICDERPTWSTVQVIAEEFVETAALLACAGDEVRVGDFSGGNCSVGARPVAVLFAPVVDAALSSRFSTSAILSGTALPSGIVLLQVQSSSRNPRARTVGDVLRADRVSSDSPELNDAPTRTSESAVTIRLGDIHFCEPQELRPSLDELTVAAAKQRAVTLLPGVYV